METAIDLSNCDFDLLKVKEKISFTHDTMDIEVENSHHYLLENGVVSHNTLALWERTTSGIEPVFKICYKRRRKVNPGETNAKIDHRDENGDCWQEYNVFHPEFVKWAVQSCKNSGIPLVQEAAFEDILKTYEELSKETLDDLVARSPWAGSESHTVDYMEKVNMQAAIQKWVDHSISVCLTGDTLIDTDKGLFYLDELTNFDNIPKNSFLKNKDFNGKILNHSNDRVNITSFYNNGIKPIGEIKLKNGLNIKSTLNERYLKLNDETGEISWEELSKLEQGDRIMLKNDYDH